jgi:excinuclease UvrABC ATPase subunit
VQELARKNKISLKAPLKDSPEEVTQSFVYGNEEGVEAELDFENMQFRSQAPYEGIVNMLEALV